MVMDGKTCMVEEYDPQLHLALTQREPIDNISYIAATLEEIEKNHIVRPKGYTVSWHVNPELEKHHFGHSHPMKPWRLTLAKGLIMSYGMHHAMDTYLSRQATKEEMADFHTEAYLEHLRTAIPVPPDDDTVKDFNLGGSDCPIFEGLFNYCSMYSGASIDAARRLCNNQSDIAINWSGGLHHAKKAEASGFCYANDIVLAILELLRVHPRVLYIDIDVHHGDGVEEAFWSTDRVMTLSFHKYDGNNFFPGTGELERNGPTDNRNPGAHHALNVPLQDGITDEQYEYLFTNVVGMCFQKYRPDAIVLQCGADSLAGDRLGRFNLQVQGHGKCVEYCKSLNVPLLLVGGGGYTPRNVARAWAHETSIAINCPLDPVIPQHTPYRSHFRYETIFPTLEEILGEQRHNKNTEKRIQEIIRHTKNELDCCAAAPSVQFTRIPPSLDGCKAEIDERMAEEVKDSDEYQKQKEAGLGVDMEL